MYTIKVTEKEKYKLSYVKKKKKKSNNKKKTRASCIVRFSKL